MNRAAYYHSRQKAQHQAIVKGVKKNRSYSEQKQHDKRTFGFDNHEEEFEEEGR